MEPKATPCAAAPTPMCSTAAAATTSSTAAAGRDTLTGGGGADTFFFAPTSGADTIIDFGDDIDTIRIGDGFGFATAGQALQFADEVGDDVVFSFAGGQVLTVLGTSIAALNNDLMV